jgi:hypothetical protein
MFRPIWVLKCFVGETAALAVAAVIYLPGCARMLYLVRLLLELTSLRVLS